MVSYIKHTALRLWAHLKKYLEHYSGWGMYMFALWLVMFLAYDFQLTKMGFYYDDWEGIFLYKQDFSAQQIWEYFLIDRPFSALVHYVYNPIFGVSSAAWHFWGVLLNWLAILFFVKMLLEIWPKRVMTIGWMGFLLAVYPGITRQFVIKTSMPHYTGMLFFMVSLWLMLYAYKNQRYRIWLVPIAILLGCLQSLLMEFFTGLELIRFFFLFYLVRGEYSSSFFQKLGRTFLAWVPYSIVFVFFIFYKFAILPSMQLAGTSTKHSIGFFTQLAQDTSGTVIRYVNLILQDMYYSIAYVWTTGITPQTIEVQSRAFIFSILFGLFSGVLAAIVIELWHNRLIQSEEREPFPAYVVVVALVAVFLGGVPAWSIGRQAIQGLWSSRFLFGQVFGGIALVVMFIVGIVGSQRRFFQHLVLAVLLISSFSLQFRTANKYVLDWAYQRNFFWQLKWRIPGLQPSAFIVSPGAATALTVDYQMAFAINIMYAPGYADPISKYWWFNGPEELRSVKANEPNSERQVSRVFRTIQFSSDMTRSVPVLANLSRGCLLMADPLYRNIPLLTDAEKLVFATSHPEMILQDETAPMPTDVFGQELPKTWCYFFQKADLARQYQDWPQVISLWDDVVTLGFYPGYGPEYWPFIEAMSRQGDWKQAGALTEKANQLTVEMSPFLCENWQRLLDTTEETNLRLEVWEKLQTSLTCSN